MRFNAFMDDNEFKVIKLPRNGPKPGQSTKAWFYGKEREQQYFEKLKAQNQ